ncbi:hypothetical protein QWJ07_32915 [Frankia sp. RB7]|nr:hypothetical protein [Frankia sp. RB7]
MTDAERQQKRRERLRKENPVQTDRQKLTQARAEVERLKQQLAATARQQSTKAAPEPKAPNGAPSWRETMGKLMNAQLDNDRLRKQLEQARKSAPEQLAPLRKRVSELEQALARREKAAQAKTAKVPFDPDTKELMALRRKINETAFSVRTKISKALTEQTTDAAARLAALKSWNSLGSNKGKSTRR